MSFFISEEQFLALILVILTFWMQLSWFPTARLYCDSYHITICWEGVSIYSVASKKYWTLFLHKEIFPYQLLSTFLVQDHHGDTLGTVDQDDSHACSKHDARKNSTLQ